ARAGRDRRSGGGTRGRVGPAPALGPLDPDQGAAAESRAAHGGRVRDALGGGARAQAPARIARSGGVALAARPVLDRRERVAGGGAAARAFAQPPVSTRECAGRRPAP